MDRLRAMQTLVRVVDAGSFTGAARQGDTAVSSAVRDVAALEQALGVRLLQRSTRQLRLTDEGRAYVDHCRRILADIAEAEAAVSARRLDVAGSVRLTAPVTFGRLHVAPALAAFQARHPALRIELLLLDRVVNLLDEGIDLAVRIGHLPDSSAVAQRLGETRIVHCASPAYLRAHPAPQRPADLAGHRLVSTQAFGSPWSFRDGLRLALPPAATAFETNLVDVALDACRAGLGIGRFLAYQVAAARARGELLTVLDDEAPPSLPIQLFYPSARLLPQRVRAVQHHLLATLGAAHYE